MGYSGPLQVAQEVTYNRSYTQLTVSSSPQHITSSSTRDNPTQRSRGSPTETGARSGRRPISRLLFPPLHSSQEVTRFPSDRRPKISKQVHSMPTLPHGDRPLNQKSITTRGMDNNYRPFRRIPAHSCSHRILEISPHSHPGQI